MQPQYEYSNQHNLIRFQMEHGQVLIHLDPLGKSFGKPPQDFLNLKSTRDFVAYLEQNNKTGNPIIMEKKNCNNPGLWAKSELAFEFAHFLNPAFGVCVRQCTENFLGTSIKQANRVKWPIPFIGESDLLQLTWYAVKRIELMDCNPALIKALEEAAFESQYSGIPGKDSSDSDGIEFTDRTGIYFHMGLEILKQDGVIYECGGTWILCPKYQGKNYAVTRLNEFKTDSEGLRVSDGTFRSDWTEEGFDFVCNWLTSDLQPEPPQSEAKSRILETV